MSELKMEGYVKDFKRVLLSCMELNHSTKALLYVLDLQTGDYRLAAYYGYLKQTPEMAVYELDHPLIHLLMRKRNPFIVNDLTNFSELEKHFSTFDLKNAQVTPIYMMDRIIAFIEERNRAGGEDYDEATMRNAMRVAADMEVHLEAFFGKSKKKPGHGPEEEMGRSYQYFLVKFASFRRYLPIISSHFQDSVVFLKPSVKFDAIVLNVTINEKSINFVYSVHPLAEKSRKMLSDSLADFFPFLGSGDNITSHFFVEKMSSEEAYEGQAETYYTMNVLERDSFSAYLCAIRFSPDYFEGEEVAALSRFSRIFSTFLSQIIREYRCFDTYIGLILNLLELSKSSGYNFRIHALNTAKYARAIAEAFTDDLDLVDAITVAALLHDIGILLIDPELFEKDSVINITDFEKVKTHTQVCMSFLEKIRVPKDIRKMIKFHHERVDGTGYPEGLEGEEIPLGSRIIAVAEAFEVMTGKTGYRKSMPVEDAVKEIVAQQDKQFDRKIVETLEKILGKKKK
ncbi:MAG: HD domain-containing protein [Acidobacteria bacterium]|nr:HD domain-containing protein [Acidobacteriota bacterium]